jgi:diguanylate cyclase (GGDEF)-like protein
MVLASSIIHNLPFVLNLTFGPALVIVLILVNYAGKYYADHYLHKLFSCLLIFFYATMFCDSTFILLEKIPGKPIYAIMHTAVIMYYLFLSFFSFFIIAFIDYTIYQKIKRTNKIIHIACIVSLAHLLVLVINLKYGFYYAIDAYNSLQYGEYRFIVFIFAYCPIVFALAEISSCFSLIKKSQLTMFIVLLFLSLMGPVFDVLLGSYHLIWSFGTAALLYSYFFILQSDSTIDPLTGIGNRFSFNEFSDRLSRDTSGESWAIVMIDMDRFKEINDTLGHYTGDLALADMGRIIKASLKGRGFAARYGGDEFVLAVKTGKKNTGNISALINEVEAAVQHCNAKNIRPYKLEISCGGDVYTADGSRSLEEFMGHIDGLMYKNKRRRSSDRAGGAAV